jgi:O-antigen/teichoic acid export membrane protein
MSASGSSGQGLLRGTIQVYLAEMLIMPVGLLVTAYLTRRLGPEPFGIFSLAITLITWIEWSVSSVFARATFTLVPRADDWRPLGTTLIRQQLLLSLIMMAAVWLLSIPIARALEAPALAWLLAVLAVDIPLFSLSQAHRNLLVGLGCFKERAYTSVARWAVRLGLVVFLVELGLSMSGAALASIGASAAELAVGRVFVRPSLFAHSSFPKRALYGFAAPLFVFALVMRVFDKLDLFAVRGLGGTLAQAGAYSVAQNLSLAPGVFSLAFAPLLMSALGRRLAEDDREGARAMARAAMRATLLMLPPAAVAGGAAPAIVLTCFGSPFAPAATLFAVLVVGAVAMVMISIATAILTVAGKPGLTVTLTAPLLPAAIIGHLLLVPRIGSLGASLVTTGLALACAGAAVNAVYRVWGVAPPVATAIRVVIVSVAAGAAARLWTTTGPALVFELAALVVGVAALLLLMGEASAQERAALRARLWLAQPKLY